MKGDRIGGPPLTAAVWGLYNFSVILDTNSYIRVDYTFHSRTPPVDPAIFSYDARIKPALASSYLSMCAGITKNGWDLSVYVDNLTDDENFLTSSHDIAGPSLYFDSSYPPRTVGINGDYHF